MKKFKITALILILSLNLTIEASSNDSTLNSFAIAGQVLSIGSQFFNGYTWYKLYKIKKTIADQANAVANNNSLNEVDRLRQLTQLRHQYDPLRQFQNGYMRRVDGAPEIDIAHILGLQARSLSTGIAINPCSKNTHPIEIFINYFNAATSIPTLIDQAGFLSDVKKAQEEALLITNENLGDFLIRKINNEFIEKINASAGTARRGYCFSTINGLNITFQANQSSSTNRSSTLKVARVMPAIGSSLDRVNVVRKRQNKNELPEDVIGIISDFAKPTPQPWQPRQLTDEEQNHIGELDPIRLQGLRARHLAAQGQTAE